MNHALNILAKILISLVIFCIALMVGLIYFVEIYYFLVIFWVSLVGIDGFFNREIYHDFLLYFIANDRVDFIIRISISLVSIMQ